MFGRTSGFLLKIGNLQYVRRFNHNRTRQLISALQVSQDLGNSHSVLTSFVDYIEKNPTERAYAIREGAQRVLIHLRDSSISKDSKEIVENSKLGLALLGYAGPLAGDGIRILSLDGGGIRGIVIMELLKMLEKLTKKKVFELFDIVCGVSTGAILICGLAAEEKLTLTECVNRYKFISHQIFHRKSTMDVFLGTSRFMRTQAYYDYEMWEQNLKQYMGYTRMIETSKSNHCPKIVCVSTTVNDDSIDAHAFRNYVLPYNAHSVYEGSHDAKLWEVVRASSAAPAFFGDFKLNGLLHQDGGILFNNPAMVAIHEAKLLWPNKNIQCLLSFGTGRVPSKRKHDGQKLYNSKMFDTEVSSSSWKTKFMRILDAATDTEQTHYILSDLMAPGSYFRFNPYITEMISMVETSPEKLLQLEKDAFLYFRRNEEKFEQAAELLLRPKNSIRTLNDFLVEKLTL